METNQEQAKTTGTRAQLEEERRIINAATAGPWLKLNANDVFTELGASTTGGMVADDDDGWHIADTCPGMTTVDGELESMPYEESKANAEFIAHARTALPLRNAQVEAVYAATHEHRRFVTADFKLPLSCVCAACDAIRAIEEAVA